jgi:hypothetical protein
MAHIDVYELKAVERLLQFDPFPVREHGTILVGVFLKGLNVTSKVTNLLLKPAALAVGSSADRVPYKTVPTANTESPCRYQNECKHEMATKTIDVRMREGDGEKSKDLNG